MVLPLAGPPKSAAVKLPVNVTALHCPMGGKAGVKLKVAEVWWMAWRGSRQAGRAGEPRLIPRRKGRVASTRAVPGWALLVFAGPAWQAAL